MNARRIALVSGLAAATALAPAAGLAAPPGGTPGAARGAERAVGPERELPPRAPPIAPEAGPGAAAPASPDPAPPPTGSEQAVLVQGYVKTAARDRLVLSAPGTTETLSLAIEERTEVLSADGEVAIEDLKQGQLVRAALVSSGRELVAVVVEVMPGERDRSPHGAEPPRETSPPNTPRGATPAPPPGAGRPPPAPGR